MSSVTKTSALLGLLASIAKVSAHGFVQGIDVAGTYYTGYLVNQYPYETDPPASIGWAETATDLGYVAPDAYASGDIICHREATNAQLSASVAAGDVVTMFWNTWPESHHGPVIDYIASCDGSCSSVDKTTLEFVKIAESGLISDTTSPGTWASDNLISNNNSWAITIPSTLAPGNYVLRHEIIALHGAGSTDGAQNYPQCINLEVTGSGTASPSGTLGESLYTETDAGILVNIYTTGLTYTIPGPALWSGGSSGSATSATGSVASSTQAAAITSSAVATKATSSVSSVPTTFATVVKSSSSASAPVETGAPDSGDDSCEA